VKNEEFIYSGDGIRSAFVADVFFRTLMTMNAHEFPNLSDEQSQTCLNYAMTKRKS